MKKYCWLCKNIVVDSGWGGSEYTPGEPNVLNCSKEHWDLFDVGMYSGDAEHLRKCLQMAEDCSDLELGHWVSQ